jgi:hypothetical protein
MAFCSFKVAGNCASPLFILNGTRQVRCVPSELAELPNRLRRLRKLNWFANLKNLLAFSFVRLSGATELIRRPK